MSDSLQSHGLQHTRVPCPSPSPGVCSNSCPLSWWCLPTISSSFVPFSSCLQSFPASGFFQWVSFSYQVAKGAWASVLPMNIQGWFPLGLDFPCGSAGKESACIAGDPGSIPSSIGKDPSAGKDWGQDELVGWHHQLNGHEFEQTSGDSERHGSQMCCSPWGRKESDMT